MYMHLESEEEEQAIQAQTYIRMHNIMEITRKLKKIGQKGRLPYARREEDSKEIEKFSRKN